MTFLFYILAALLIWLSYKSFRGGLDYLNYFKKELAKPRSEYTPFATVIAPCKGFDEGLEENLAALLTQDYPAYEVIFVVDDRHDASVVVIDRLIECVSERRLRTSSRHPLTQAVPTCNSARLVVAPKAKNSSQKVENLSEAVLHVADESRVFVFVDSDARPAADWLRHLTAPLEDGEIGVATGYRWFISQSPTFPSEMRSMWNASVASALGPNTESNFCWGGSMAIRRHTFERLDIRGHWSGTLSDDFTVTRTMNDAKMKIHFVPQALTPSIENCTLREMLEFTNRQMKITHVYAPKLWMMSFFGSGLFNAVMIAAFLIVIFSSRNSFAVWFSIGTFTLVSLFSVAKSTLRLRSVRLVLTNYAAETRKQFFFQNVLWLFAPALFLFNCVAALFSRRINWRGTVYEMRSMAETAIISRPKVRG